MKNKIVLLLALALLAGTGRPALAQRARLVQMTITGRVFLADSAGMRPQPGVRVSVDVPARGPMASRMAQTDASGNFTLAVLADSFASLPDSLTVRAFLLGFGSQPVRLKKAPQARALFWLTLVKMVIHSAHVGPRPLPPAKTAPTSQAVFWPPPQCSTMQRLDPRYFAKARTLSQVDTLLQTALKGATYDNSRYYYAPGGFVLLTRLEQTDTRGYALPGDERWSGDVAGEAGNSLVSYFKAIFLPTVGYFRVIAFVVTDQTISTHQPAPKKGTALSWLAQGADGLDSHLGALPYGPGYHCTALVYEFRQGDDGSGELVTPNAHSVAEHLATSRIARGLPRLQP